MAAASRRRGRCGGRGARSAETDANCSMRSGAASQGGGGWQGCGAAGGAAVARRTRCSRTRRSWREKKEPPRRKLPRRPLASGSLCPEMRPCRICSAAAIAAWWRARFAAASCAYCSAPHSRFVGSPKTTSAVSTWTSSTGGCSPSHEMSERAPGSWIRTLPTWPARSSNAASEWRSDAGLSSSGPISISPRRRSIRASPSK